MSGGGPEGEPRPRRVLFVTGHLAEPALRRVLRDMQPPFAFDVAVLRITAAALMTTPWIARNLTVPTKTDLVLIPGLCEGDPAVLAERFNVRVERGPKDLREIPAHFGRSTAARGYGAWDIEIIAEINNVPQLTREALWAQAAYFRDAGADVIDLGCMPGTVFDELGDVVRELTAAGVRVSVDSFAPDEIRAAVEAGAEMVLSVNRSNLDAVRECRSSNVRVVAVPELGGGLETLGPIVEQLERWDIRYILDPILEPIGFGFTTSLERYAEVRRRYPDAEMLMGVGNLTEMTAADSTGVNAVLIAICQELGVRTVLTTEVIPWARGAVREIDVARRLMHHAVTRRVVPKGIDDRLVTVKDPTVFTYTRTELESLQARVRDPNFRLFADETGITVLNHEHFVTGTDVDEIFVKLGVTDASHAFYLGQELAHAKLAVDLGKTYRQDDPLEWGYLTPSPSRATRRVRLTPPHARQRHPDGRDDGGRRPDRTPVEPESGA